MLLQEGHPIVLASKPLTENKAQYSNIEWQSSTVVFICEQFNTKVYGRIITAIKDYN